MIAQEPEYEPGNLNDLIKEVHKNSPSTHIIVIGRTIKWKERLPNVVMRRWWAETPYRTFENVDIESYRNNIKTTTQMRQSKDFEYISLSEYFCNNAGCIVYFDNDPKFSLQSIDNAHFSLKTSDKVAQDLIIPKIKTNKSVFFAH